MDLNVLLEPKVDLERLTKVLDELGHEGRTHTIRTWGRHQIELLWEATKSYRPITLDHFVRPSVGPKVEVVHELKNSLAMFNVGQKRFCRPDDGEGELWGYNEQPMRALTGPGYFVARPSEVPGEVLIDCTTLPKGRVESWPAIVPNTNKLGRFVFAGIVDHIRGVSQHVSIGRAHRNGTPTDTWFVLNRKDPN